MSAYVFSAFGSNTHGSGAQNPNAQGSGAQGSSKYSHCSRHAGSYNGLFSPTMEPTEELPPIYQPPRPTYYPTSSMNIPKIPITFKTSSDITIPNMPLTFQIRQGGNGWSDYPDTPPLNNAVSTILGMDKKYITNMRVKINKRRMLLSSFDFYYNITTPPISTDPDIIKSTYNDISYKLKTAVIKGEFTSNLRKQGYAINITSIEISRYDLVKQPETNAIESTGKSNTTTTSYNIYVSIIAVTITGLIISGCYYIYKRRKAYKIETEAKCIDSIPNPLNSQIEITQKCNTHS